MHCALFACCRTRLTNAFTVARGDRTVMWPLVKLTLDTCYGLNILNVIPGQNAVAEYSIFNYLLLIGLKKQLKQLVKTELLTQHHPLCSPSHFHLDENLVFLDHIHLCQNPATIMFVNFTVSTRALIPIPLLPLLFTSKLIIIILFTITCLRALPV